MDAKLRQLSRLLKRYDSDLFPKRFADGALGIFRKRKSYDLYRFPAEQKTLWVTREWDDLILPCTETWVEGGLPVDWGIEPIFWQIQKMDGWRDDGDYDRFATERNRIRSNRQRAFKNEVRARAADLRGDFARATNDINTSSLEKIDKRRMNDAYRG